MNNERYYELQNKYIELQKAFDDTLALNQKLGSENVKLEEQIKKMRCCENCKHHYWAGGTELSCRLRENECEDMMKLEKWELDK